MVSPPGAQSRQLGYGGGGGCRSGECELCCVISTGALYMYSILSPSVMANRHRTCSSHALSMLCGCSKAQQPFGLPSAPRARRDPRVSYTGRKHNRRWACQHLRAPAAPPRLAVRQQYGHGAFRFAAWAPALSHSDCCCADCHTNHWLTFFHHDKNNDEHRRYTHPSAVQRAGVRLPGVILQYALGSRSRFISSTSYPAFLRVRYLRKQAAEPAIPKTRIGLDGLVDKRWMNLAVKKKSVRSTSNSCMR